MAWLTVLFVIVVLIAVWLTWTAMRIDRLNARIAAAWLSLDAALRRRSAALRAIIDQTPQYAESPSSDGIRAVISSPHDGVGPSMRAGLENTISAAVADLDLDRVRPQDAEALRVACDRVRVARVFYNDGVRAAQVLRAQRVPRWSGLSRRLTDAEFLDMDDSPPAVAPH